MLPKSKEIVPGEKIAPNRDEPVNNQGGEEDARTQFYGFRPYKQRNIDPLKRSPTTPDEARTSKKQCS